MGISKTPVVNLFGAPGAGKSTGAALLFAALKQAEVNAELVTEFAKDLTWEGNQTALAAQDYVFGQQHYRIRRVIDQVDVVVTDCPLLLSSFYAGDDPTLGRAFHEHVKHVFSQYNNVNFLVMRSKQYNPAGRNQTESESDLIAYRILQYLTSNNIPFHIIPGSHEGYRKMTDVVSDILFSAENSVLKEEES